ncbi:MAG: tryptophan 7-halogenase [Alphaproteobacteria bacterium]|nr:tryptophan 7-halogenase [Alphaproteobacteria bacterium]
MTEQRDCVVIGGGPAGATFAGIVSKYAPHLSVTVLERARFPRWRIGESTIPVMNGVLRDLGLFDEMIRTCPVKKLGAVFVWGKDRTPWNVDFLALHGLGSVQEVGTIDIVGRDLEALRGGRKDLKNPLIAFNVRRDRFDQRLLERAGELGAEVRFDTEVTDVLRDDAGAVCGVRWSSPDGEGTIHTPFVLDASGLASMLTRGDRQRDDFTNNFAAFGYLSNAGWKVTCSGTRDFTTVYIVSCAQGWIWYFPIDEDVMSVGCVTRTEHFRERMKEVSLEEFYWETLRGCPEVADLITDASLRDDIMPNGARVRACQDWSSWARRFVGPGWASAGDAAVFIDPIISSGMTRAMLSAHRAAYTFLTQHARPEVDREALWETYADFVRGEASAMLRLARLFYGNNRAVDSVWWESRRLVNAEAKIDIGDREAFAMAAAGFFPSMRAVSPEVLKPLLSNLSGMDEDIVSGARDRPRLDDLDGATYTASTPFSLALQAEPAVNYGPKGQLLLYHDLVTRDWSMSHRMAAYPCRIPEVMAPVVDAMRRHTRVDALVDEAVTLLPARFGAAAVRKATHDLVRSAAIKGFIQVRTAADV